MVQNQIDLLGQLLIDRSDDGRNRRQGITGDNIGIGQGLYRQRSYR